MSNKYNFDISYFKRAFIPHFESISKENKMLYKLIYETSNETNVFFIGGFLRSIFNKQKPKDLDIIFNLDQNELERILFKYDVHFRKNKLNGYKILLPTITVDIWTVESNWAFKSKIINNYETNLIEKIANGTFFNYDSLVYDLYSQNIHIRNYNECRTSNTLDIIRKSSRYCNENPGKINNVLRAFLIRKRTKIEFSSNLCKYIENQIILTGLTNKKDIIDRLYLLANNNPRFKEINSNQIIEESLRYVYTKTENKFNNQLVLFPPFGI